MDRGTLTPDSLISSNDISSVKISNIIGKGTLLLEATIANKNSVGIKSWWNVVIAIYKPGSKSVTKKPKSLIALSKSENWYLIFISSGDVKKSISTAGATRA